MMRQVHLASLGCDVAAIGFGCASLAATGSLNSGLRSLHRAREAGVTCYDIAPSHGAAELMLAQFLAEDRADIQVITQVELDPPAPSLTQRIKAYFSARAGQQPLRDGRPDDLARLTGECVTRSIEGSLRRLATDYVDVLAVPIRAPDLALRDDAIRALEDLITTGKARAIALASDSGAIGNAHCARLVHLANNPFRPSLAPLRTLLRNSGLDALTHSAYDGGTALHRLAHGIEHDSHLRIIFDAAGYEGVPRAVAAQFLADYAFATNCDGVVIMSLTGAHHLPLAIASLERRRDPAVTLQVADHILARIRARTA